MILQKLTIHKPPDRQIIFIVRIFNQFQKLTMTTHTPLISFSLHCVVSMHRRPCRSPSPVALCCCRHPHTHPRWSIARRHRPPPSAAAIGRRHWSPPSAAAIGRPHRSSPVALTAAHRPHCRPRCRPRWLSSLLPLLFPSPIARHSRS